MKPASFPEQTTTFAENQPEYMPLPAYKHKNAYGEITCCWKLTWKERLKLLFTGIIWHSIWTFNQPLQPQLLSVDKPTMQQKTS